MLNTIRNSMKGTVGKAVVTFLFGILIVSFAIWGIQDIFRNGLRSDTVAKIGDTQISGNEFLGEFQRELKVYQQQLGPQFTADNAIAAGLDNQILQRMITRTAFDNETFDMGLRVSDQTVVDYIRKNPTFDDQIGGFNRMQYEYVLQQMGITQSQFEQQTRFDIAREYLIDALIGGRKAPKILTDKLFEYRNEKRVVEIAYLPDDTISDVPTPDDAAVESFYKERIERFTAPEYRAISYIMLGPETMLPEVQVSDEAVHDLYDSRKSEYMPGEKRNLQAMNFLDEDAAQKAHDAVAGGLDFAEAAKQFNASNQSDLSLGQLTQTELQQRSGENVAIEAFSVPVGGVTKPIKNVFGNWTVVRVVSTSAGLGKTFDQVKDELHKELAMEKASDALYDLLSKIEDALAGGATLEEVAEMMNLKIRTIQDIDRTGDLPSGLPVPDLPESRKFLDFAYEAHPGDDLELTDGGDNHYYVIRVDGITPSAPKPLDTVRNDVVKAWQDQKRREMAQERAKSLADWAGHERVLSTVAVTAGGRTVTSRPLLRDGSVSEENITQSLLAKIFETPEDGTGWGAAPDGKGYVLFKVTSITTPDPLTDKNEAVQVARQISANIANDLLGEYQAYIKNDFGVTVDNAALKSALSQVTNTQ